MCVKVSVCMCMCVCVRLVAPYLYRLQGVVAAAAAAALLQRSGPPALAPAALVGPAWPEPRGSA